MSSILKYLEPELINLSLKAADKNDAIMKMCEMIAARRKICDPKQLFENIMNRESLKTTAVGHGIAIPHSRCDFSDSITVAAGICERPVDFGAPDAQPIRLIMVIVASKNDTASYLQTLSQIASLLHSEKVRQELFEAKTQKDFIDIIKKNERR